MHCLILFYRYTEIQCLIIRTKFFWNVIEFKIKGFKQNEISSNCKPAHFAFALTHLSFKFNFTLTRLTLIAGVDLAHTRNNDMCRAHSFMT